MGYAKSKGAILKLGSTTISQRAKVTPPGWEPDKEEVTHLDSTWKEYVSTVQGGQECSCEVIFDFQDEGHIAMLDHFTDGCPTSEWSVTYASGTVSTFDGFAVGIDWGELTPSNTVRATFKIQMTGEPDVEVGSG